MYEFRLLAALSDMRMSSPKVGPLLEHLNIAKLRFPDLTCTLTGA